MSFWKAEEGLVNAALEKVEESVRQLIAPALAAGAAADAPRTGRASAEKAPKTVLAKGQKPEESGLAPPPDDVSESQAFAICRDLLLASGTLVFLEQEQRADRLLSEHRAFLAPLVRRTVEDLEAGEMDGAARDILLLASDLELAEGPDLDRLQDRVFGALSVRDRAEVLLAGAAFVLGEAPAVSDDFLSSVMAFDEVLRPELWRLAPLGAKRAAGAAWVAPALRTRFWWRTLGADLPADALESLSVAARLLFLFPEAEKELERLKEAERFLERGLERERALKRELPQRERER